MLEKISEATYCNGTVTLAPATDGGWKVDDANTATTTELPSIPAFMKWCRENYSWPMPA